jgi:hypothetical protein
VLVSILEDYVGTYFAFVCATIRMSFLHVTFSEWHNNFSPESEKDAGHMMPEV